MDDFVKKCIQDHRNPLVKVTLPSQKFFLGAKTEEEKQLINDHQEHLRTILKHQRIEKRSARAQALWLENKNVAQVTKVVKNLVKYFGFQNKDGLFLYPEEMLFLLETNRLEVHYNNRSLNLEKAYDIVLKNTNITLSKYRIYRKLALLGYKIVRFEQTENKILSRSKKIDLKRVLEDTGEKLEQTKKIKQEFSCQVDENVLDIQPSENVQVSETATLAATRASKEAEYVYNILNGITKMIPRQYCIINNSDKPEYCIFSPANVAKLKPDFNLFVCEGNILEQRGFKCEIPIIYASCVDDVAFYRFADVHLPHI